MKLSIPTRHYHSVLGIVLGLWLYVLLVFLAPYDAAPLSFEWRAKLMLGYGVIFALSYRFAHSITEHYFLKKPSDWWVKQLWFLLIFVCLNFPFVYWYYKSSIVLGEYALYDFVTQVYLTTLVVVTPLMIYGRRQFNYFKTKINHQLIIKGENKRDLLQLPLKDIFYIETARNYVEVHYQQEGTMRKKLIRTTLKKITSKYPELLQIHRSYLVNPNQIIGWQGSKSVMIRGREIPVSDSYRAQLIAHFKTHP